MRETTRRDAVRAITGLGLVGLAGCTARTPVGGTGTQTPTASPASGDSLTDWERSTECDRTPSAMYDSVIRVESVATSLGNGYVPIRYSELTSGERDILDTVTEDGGFGTCDTSDGFNRFVDRIRNHRDRQSDAADDMRVYLERNGTYYRLYVETFDQVYAH